MSPDAAGDVGRVLAVADAATAADGAAPLDEATLIALRDGEVTAHVSDHGFTLWHGGDLTLVVAPDARGQGHGTRLLGAAAAEHDGAETAWSHGNHPAAAALARAHGWTRARDLWVMRRPVGEPLPDLAAPDGVAVRGFVPGDAEALVAVNAAAFAQHPEQGAMDLANFTRRTAEEWWDPAGLLVAYEGEDLLGFHWTKVHPAAPGEAPLGEVYVVGVSPDAQGRGLGRLLTLAGLHHLHEAGVREVILYVESDNVPAVATYERLGFTHADVDTHVQYARA